VKIRWSGPELLSAVEAGDYGIPEGSLFVWAGEADDAGHVDSDAWRYLPPSKHDAIRNGHGVVLYGPDTDAWVGAMVAEMLEELTA
jgi:hypothetical protein